MKCLVLGGGGFIGSHVVDGLLAAGHAVRVFERPRVPHFRTFTPPEAVEWFEGDFQSASMVEDAVHGCEVIVHLVSTTLPKDSNDDPVFDVESNVVGTLRMLHAASQAKVRKVVFISSGGTIYGMPLAVPIPESHPTEPRVSYAIAKLAIEKYLALFQSTHGLDHVVLRVANPYGERQRVDAAQGAVAVFLDRALRRECIEIWGDGTVVRDYLHVSDVARAFLRAIDYSGEPRVFNIGSGTGCSLNELLAAIEGLLGRTIERRYLPGRGFDVPRNVLDITRARDVLGWAPRVSLEDGLRAMLAWARP
jgi:UDP-glucose 4-epimerase